MIIDAHTHIGSCNWKGHEKNVESVEWAIDYLQQCGIDMIITTPWQAVLCGEERDLDEGNAEALALHEKYPEMVYPGVVVDYRWPKRSLEWIETFEKAGFRWVGEMVQKEPENPFTHPDWHDLFAAAEEKKMIVQLHNTTGTAVVAKAFPKLQVIGSHLNPEVLPSLVDLPNVMVDISGMHGGLFMNTISNAKKMFGVDRLLYGTDFDGYDPLAFIARCKYAFTPEEQENLFSGNVLKLLQE